MADAISEVMGETCEEENVKRWEVGRRVPTPRWRDAIAEVYGVPRREVDKAVDASRNERRLSALMDDSFGQDVDRRVVVLGAAALAAGAAAEPWGRLAAALGGSPVDAEGTTALQATTAGMFDSEEHIPAGLMFHRLCTHLDTITALLPSAGRYRQALTIAAGETAALAGWMSWDLGDLEGAARYYAVAGQASQAAEHGPVAALALGYRSYATTPARAQEMLSEAQKQVRGPGYATARAWLSAREAEEAGKAGDREGALRALERARTAFDYANPGGEQAWVAFFRSPRLASMVVSTLAQLRHPDLAAEADASLAALGADDAKIRCSVLGDAAVAYIVAGDVDRAVEVGARALDATVQDDTTMGRIRLHALTEQLPRAAAADELAERIRTALPA
jgi:tetratricopeptide (TPR) repeat protein